MNTYRYRFVPALSISLLLSSCSSLKVLESQAPISGVELAAKNQALSESDLQEWLASDPQLDSIPGISLNRVKASLKTRPKKSVVVAIVDSGVDLNHEGFGSVFWVNEDEIPNNGIDDDNNGYVDDINGYNFLGEIYYEQMEYVRMLARGVGSEEDLAKAKKIHASELEKAQENKSQYKRLYTVAKTAIDTLASMLQSQQFDAERLGAYTPETAYMAQQKAILSQLFTYVDNAEGLLSELSSGLSYFAERYDYNLNLELNARDVLGDDPYDFNDRIYGDSDPQIRNEEESHGTHVAGIIHTIAPFAQLMFLRAVPAGDEYDKDVALAIRYAVDNGANIINCSFGKSFSPGAEWVWDALRYAEHNDVLVVHAAGNDGKDLDTPNARNYPDDSRPGGVELVSNFISVGALAPSLDQGLVANYSNFGRSNVDVFAPGDEIYSFMPNNTYEFQGGTSMAAPVVSATAAWLKAYFPKKSAAQIKQILLDSSIRLPLEVVVPGSQLIEPFRGLSKTGGILNLYNALLSAQSR
jgi:cell wall-associated protease